MTIRSIDQTNKQIVPDVHDLNNDIKSRLARLREHSYMGRVWIKWSQQDCEMSSTITAGFTVGTDGGDRERFLTRVLIARFTFSGDELRLLFGEDVASLRPYSIQLVNSERDGTPHEIRVRATDGANHKVLLTVSGKEWNELHPWLLCIGGAFQRFASADEKVLLPAGLR